MFRSPFPEGKEKSQPVVWLWEEILQAAAEGQDCREHPSQGAQTTARATSHPSGLSLSSKAKKFLISFNGALSWVTQNVNCIPYLSVLKLVTVYLRPCGQKMEWEGRGWGCPGLFRSRGTQAESLSSLCLLAFSCLYLKE